MGKYYHCMMGIIIKELLRFIHEKSRFFSALVRPLLWLFIFSVGFKSALGLAITPPYETYITYETYIVPGLVGMILLFNGMQSSLAMIFDKEMGSMKILLASHINRNFLLFSKMTATAIVSTIQALTFLLIASLYGIELSAAGVLLALPFILLGSIALNAFALFIASVVKQLQNFASIMNFVIFPMFFLSSALYPLWKIQENSLFLYEICRYNPFTFIVESIRFALYEKMDIALILPVSGALTGFLLLAFWGYKSKKILKKG